MKYLLGKVVIFKRSSYEGHRVLLTESKTHFKCVKDRPKSTYIQVEQEPDLLFDVPKSCIGGVAITLIKDDEEWLSVFPRSEEEELEWLLHVGKLCVVSQEGTLTPC
jgi:hypothetical protein